MTEKLNANADGRLFRKIREVKIVSVTTDGTLVTFEADARLVDARDKEDVDPKNLDLESLAMRRIQGTFVMKTSDLWQTAGGEKVEASVKLEPGSLGPLYVEETASSVKGTSERGSAYARGVAPPVLEHDEIVFRPKWPDGGGADDPSDAEGIYSTLELNATSIVLVGYLRGSKSIKELDLLDKNLVVPGQTVKWGGSQPVKVELTKAGCAIFGIQGAVSLEIWPIAVIVVGRPSDGTGRQFWVDLRNLVFASPVQRLAIDEPGKPVRPQLSSEGKARFGWVSPDQRAAIDMFYRIAREQPDLVRAFSNLLAGLDDARLMRLRRATSPEDWIEELGRVINPVADPGLSI